MLPPFFQSQRSEEGGPVFDRLSKDDRKYRRCYGPSRVPFRCHRCPAFQGMKTRLFFLFVQKLNVRFVNFRESSSSVRTFLKLLRLSATASTLNIGKYIYLIRNRLTSSN